MKSDLFYVYIVRCLDKSYYTGYTDDLEQRLKEHNGVLAGGAKYTRSRRPVELIYREPFQNRLEAVRREREIKKMSRAGKETLIKKNEDNNI